MSFQTCSLFWASAIAAWQVKSVFLAISDSSPPRTSVYNFFFSSFVNNGDLERLTRMVLLWLALIFANSVSPSLLIIASLPSHFWTFSTYCLSEINLKIRSTIGILMLFEISFWSQSYSISNTCFLLELIFSIGRNDSVTTSKILKLTLIVCSLFSFGVWLQRRLKN